MGPVTMALKEKYDNKITFIVADLEDPETEKLLEKFDVRYIPAFFYVDGNRNILSQDTGKKSFNYLEKEIKKYLLEVK